MQINLNDNPALKDALLQRLKAEFAETCMANFVLDMVVDGLGREKAELQKRVEELIEANTRLNNDCTALRAELERVTRPERTNGSDPLAIERARGTARKTAA